MEPDLHRYITILIILYVQTVFCHCLEIGKPEKYILLYMLLWNVYIPLIIMDPIHKDASVSMYIENKPDGLSPLILIW